MTALADWLQAEMNERDLTQAQVAVYAGVGQATLSGILRKGHVPRIETLFRLADYFHISRLEILRLAGHLRSAEELTQGGQLPAGEDDELVAELLEEFDKVPDPWKVAAIQHVAVVARMAGQPDVRISGGEEVEGAAASGSN